MDILRHMLSPTTYGFNGLDIVVFCILFFYAYEGYILGFVGSALDLVSFVVAFLVATQSYSFVGSALITFFNLPPGFAKAIGFFVIALVSEILFSLLLRRVYARYIQEFFLGIPETVKRVEKFCGILPGLLSAYIILAFLFSVVLALPTTGYLKRIVTSSKFGSPLVAQASNFESGLRGIFGGAFQESLTFLSVKPDSNETVNLRFTVTNGTVDKASEDEMLRLLNIEREKNNLPHLVLDTKLRDLGRVYSNEMFSQGYFSHIDRVGRSPFDRMENAGINFTQAGENLALAPSVELAMQGLMNSSGHRANILSKNYHKVGIGVIDGGIYGKMFSQEFTD